MATITCSPVYCEGKGRNGYFGIAALNVWPTTENSWLPDKTKPVESAECWDRGKRVSIDVEGQRGSTNARLVLTAETALQLSEVLRDLARAILQEQEN